MQQNDHHPTVNKSAAIMIARPFFLLLLILQFHRLFAFNIAGNVKSLCSSLCMNSKNDEDKANDDDVPIIAQSTVKIDDHGSDLTNRFKYKVKNENFVEIFRTVNYPYFS